MSVLADDLFEEMGDIVGIPDHISFGDQFPLLIHHILVGRLKAAKLE